MIQLVSPSPRRKARIEIIPLIDIVFFLLATFVLVSMSMIKNHGVPIRLPVATTSKALDRTSSLIIRITKEGAITLDQETYALGTMDIPLATFQKSNPDPRVVIQGDTDVPYGQVIAVLDAVRKAGISKVAVQTSPKKV